MTIVGPGWNQLLFDRNQQRTNWFQMDNSTGSSVPPFATSSEEPHPNAVAMVFDGMTPKPLLKIRDFDTNAEEQSHDFKKVKGRACRGGSCRRGRLLG